MPIRPPLILASSPLCILPDPFVIIRDAVSQEVDIRPSDGLAIFLRKLPENTIILRFVDDASSPNGLVCVDFPPNCFEGWQERTLRKDTFLEPQVQQMLNTKPRSWCQLDFGVTMKSKDPEHQHPSHPIGTMVDVQSFVAEERSEDDSIKFESVVRVNITKALNKAKALAQAMSSVEGGGES